MSLYQLGDLTPQTSGSGRVWVAPDARVIGDVRIGEEVSVWFGAVIRADNEPIRIGARTNKCDSCV